MLFADDIPILRLKHRLQLVDAQASMVCQPVVLEQLPEPLDRIEVRGVGRKPFHMDVRAAGQVMANQRPAMYAPAVPQQDQRPTQVPLQFPQESHHGLLADGIATVHMGIRPHVVGYRRKAQGPDDRKLQPVAVRVAFHQVLPAKAPGVTRLSVQAKARFIGQNQMALGLDEDFFIRGNSSLIQRRISASLRSLGTRRGLRRLAPKLCRKRDMEPG